MEEQRIKDAVKKYPNALSTERGRLYLEIYYDIYDLLYIVIGNVIFDVGDLEDMCHRVTVEGLRKMKERITAYKAIQRHRKGDEDKLEAELYRIASANEVEDDMSFALEELSGIRRREIENECHERKVNI